MKTYFNLFQNFFKIRFFCFCDRYNGHFLMNARYDDHANGEIIPPRGKQNSFGIMGLLKFTVVWYFGNKFLQQNSLLGIGAHGKF